MKMSKPWFSGVGHFLSLGEKGVLSNLTIGERAAAHFTAHFCIGDQFDDLYPF